MIPGHFAIRDSVPEIKLAVLLPRFALSIAETIPNLCNELFEDVCHALILGASLSKSITEVLPQKEPANIASCEMPRKIGGRDPWESNLEVRYKNFFVPFAGRLL